jgi:hypothetical protein
MVPEEGWEETVAAVLKRLGCDETWVRRCVRLADPCQLSREEALEGLNMF